MAQEPGSTSRSPRWRALLLTVIIGSVVVVVVWAIRQPPEFAGARHVVLISLDTTRADHLGCYGNGWIRTPRLDALASESILFTDCMTVVSTTLSSHTSLFTGKYPHTHGVPRNGFIVHDDNVMLPELLKQAGFHTGAFVGSFALDKRFNFAQGFDHFDQQYQMLVGDDGVRQDQRRAAGVTDAVIEYLDRVGVPGRLFLFVHYFDPHHPYDPPPPYDTMYGAGRGGIGLEGHPALRRGLPPDDVERKLCGYAGEVSYMDEQVGRLVDDLKRRGILDDALLVVTSDHGENLGENRGVTFDHGWTAYQVDMHVVAMIRLPGTAHGGTRLDLPAASIDVLPTVLNYLGVPMPEGVEGAIIDLADPRDNELSRIRFGEASKPWDAESDPHWYNNPKPRCVRAGPFKYIQARFREAEELYDLSSDPYEARNLLAALAPDSVTRAAELRVKLEAWSAAQNPLPSHFDQQQRDETIRRLKALGYLRDSEDDSETRTP